MNKYYLTLPVVTLITGILLQFLSACGSGGDEMCLDYDEPPVTGSWGDQGDGTFVNPILNSNYPDSDVEEYDGKWYMISSKGSYMKGMTILESEDLVNWEIVGGIVDSLTWKTSTGVWAGDLVRHDDKWLCYFIDFDNGLFVCEADDIKGKWSAPQLILEKKGMTDPAVFWDYDSEQAYMLCNYQIDENGKKRIYHQRLFRLSWDGKNLLDDGVDIYVEEGAEAAKIYKINGTFYIFLSEWMSDENGRKLDRRQVALRSGNIYGPYEKRILLEKGNGTDRSCCQGSLLQAPDSSWWYMHQLVQARNTYEGRPQCLIPVKWKDGWPLLGEDPDGNGIGNIVWKSKKPIQGKPIRMVRTDDDFNAAELSPQWLWAGNPDNGKWSLTARKGFLRLYSAAPSDNARKYATLPNKLFQRKMGKGKDTVIVKMMTDGMKSGQTGGIVCTGSSFISFGIQCSGRTRNIVMDMPGKRLVGDEIRKKQVWLKLTMDGNKLDCEYSTDGLSYIPFGEEYTMETRGFDGIFVGLFSMNENGKGYVDFDWFKYDYDGPKSVFLAAK